MSKLNREEVFAAILITFGAVFVSALSWQILVTNYARNVERDKFLAGNCKNIEEQNGLFSKRYVCKEEKK